MPGSDAGPWLRGTKADHALWTSIFNAGQEPHYRARKGITTDLNGVYFVRAEPASQGRVYVTNDPSIGRKRDLPRVRRAIEADHVFPLIRGRGLQSFRAVVEPEFKVIVPQRGMHGDPKLPVSAPRTYQFFAEFERWLKDRGSYRRYQAKQPYWSIWSTGAYTFSPYKVLWKEMSGSRFCAGYIGSVDDPILGRKVIVPDHKLYFVPVETLPEAQYLTGILNVPTIATAIASYASQLSVGTSVIENLTIPGFDSHDAAHAEIARIAGEIADRGGGPSMIELGRLTELTVKVVSEHGR